MAIILAIFSTMVLASLVCEIKPPAESCSASQTELFRLSNNQNAHAELTTAPVFYPWNVCCEAASDTLSSSCVAPDAIIASLSGATNAHVEIPSETNYVNDVCLSSAAGTVSCDYITGAGDGFTLCNANGYDTCVATLSGNTNAHATDCITNPYNLKICCRHTFCYGYISGKVEDALNLETNIEGAEVRATQQGTGLERYAFSQPSGKYGAPTGQRGRTPPDFRGYLPEDNIPCGTYNMIASKSGYIPDTKSNIVVGENEDLKNVDFLLTSATNCLDDCTYAGDSLIHKECDGYNGCSFCDETTKRVCDLAQPGWIRDYGDGVNEVECGEGCPKEKNAMKAIVTCEYENIIKLTKIITYKGKLIRLVVATCG